MTLHLDGQNHRYRIVIRFPWHQQKILHCFLYTYEQDSEMVEEFIARVNMKAYWKYRLYFDMYLGYLKELLGL